MNTKARIGIAMLALILILGIGFLLIFQGGDAALLPDASREAASSGAQNPDDQPLAATPQDAAPQEIEPQAPAEPAWERSPMPEADAEGKTSIRFFIDVPPRMLEKGESDIFYFTLTEAQLAEWQNFTPENRSLLSEFMQKHPKSRGSITTDDHQEALLSLDPDVVALSISIRMKFKRGAYQKPASITSETGRFEADTIGYGEGLLHIQDRVDRVTITYSNLGILGGDLLMDGKRLSGKDSRPLLREKENPLRNWSYPESFSFGKANGKSFQFEAVPLNTDLVLEFRPYNKSFDDANTRFPMGMSYEVEIAPFTEGEVRSELEYELPMLSAMTINIKGRDFTQEDWRFDFRVVYRDENEREVEIQKYGYSNRNGDKADSLGRFFPKASSFPLRLSSSVMLEMLGEAWKRGAMQKEDRCYQRFLEFLPSYQSRSEIQVTWGCPGYKEWKTTLNCADVMRKMVAGETDLAFTAEESLLDANVKIIDAFNGQPIPYATLTLLPTHGQPAPIYTADSNGEVRFQAPTDGKNLRVILGAKGYGSLHHDIIVDGSMSVRALHLQIEGWIEFLVVDEEGKPIRKSNTWLEYRMDNGYGDNSDETRKRIGSQEISARYTGLRQGAANLVITAKGYRLESRSFQIERGKKHEISERIQLTKVAFQERTLDLTAYAARMKPIIDAIEYPKMVRYLNITGGTLTPYEIDRMTRFSHAQEDGELRSFNGMKFSITGRDAKLKVTVQYDPSSPALFFGVLGERVLLRDESGTLVFDEAQSAKVSGRVSGAPRPEILSAHIYEQEQIDAKIKHQSPIKGGSYDYVVPVNADGSFEFPSVGTGVYVVYISHPGEGQNARYDLSATDTPVQVVVTGGEAKNVSLKYRNE